MNRWIAALFSGILIGMTACQPGLSANLASHQASQADLVTLPESAFTDTPIPSTPVLALPTAQGASKISATEATTIGTPAHAPEPTSTGIAGTPVSDPLHFVFPAPGPAPVSAWRPPLYPIPWAPTSYDHFFFARPIGADEVNWPLADYRYGGVFFGNVVHTGVDIPAPRGTPVLAAGPGKVTWAGFGLYSMTEDPNDPYGLAVAIKHDFGYQGDSLYTVYGHMEKILVKKGQHVNTGDLIGQVGDTGKVTGVHLHFEVRVAKNNFFGSRNPELWMSPPQGWGILAARVMDRSGEPLYRQAVQVFNQDTNQSWTVNTYGNGSTNSDPYYNENMVIGDLPAGNYVVWIPYNGSTYNLNIQIKPGLVSYFTFRGRDGFFTSPPPNPPADFTPPAPGN
ncbi:MAG TPA: M23 family metallopeptidase [Anaerolineales bacterium]